MAINNIIIDCNARVRVPDEHYTIRGTCTIKILSTTFDGSGIIMMNDLRVVQLYIKLTRTVNCVDG